MPALNSLQLLLFRHDLAEVCDGRETSEDAVQQIKTASANLIVFNHDHHIVEKLVERLANARNLAKGFIVLAGIGQLAHSRAGMVCFDSMGPFTTDAKL